MQAPHAFQTSSFRINIRAYGVSASLGGRKAFFERHLPLVQSGLGCFRSIATNSSLTLMQHPSCIPSLSLPAAGFVAKRCPFTLVRLMASSRGSDLACLMACFALHNARLFSDAFAMILPCVSLSFQRAPGISLSCHITRVVISPYDLLSCLKEYVIRYRDADSCFSVFRLIHVSKRECDPLLAAISSKYWSWRLK